MYTGIDIILATKHQKELAIQKPFEEAFGAKLFIPDDYDTDQFGTFSGEVSRQGTAYETVINKAKQACVKYGFEYGIANEGCFGPHPTLYLVPGDVELISFIDLNNEIVVVETEISTETNYAYCDLKGKSDYQLFLKKINFGSHGLIIRALDGDQNIVLAKGITDFLVLQKLIKKYVKQYSELRLETDMRAMMNPTRMQVIHRLSKKLIQRLKTYCKKCQLPGFGKVSVSGNLLCAFCHAKTSLYQYTVMQCVRCEHQEYHPREDGLLESDPKYCQLCNP